MARIEVWSSAGRVRAVLVKVLVTVGGPMVIVAGVAMLVLPGPGLVVIALGFALLALEYAWARHALGLLGYGLARVKQLLFPAGGSRSRRLLGAGAAAGFVVATTVATSAITALIGTQALA